MRAQLSRAALTTFNAVTVNGVNFGVPLRAYNFNNQDEAWITRIGLNYRFGGGLR